MKTMVRVYPDQGPYDPHAAFEWPPSPDDKKWSKELYTWKDTVMDADGFAHAVVYDHAGNVDKYMIEFIQVVIP